MRNSKIVTVDSQEIVVKELTVNDLDSLLSQDVETVTVLDRILDKDMLSGNILAASTGIPEKELSKMAPSEMRPLIDAFKETNPDFFQMALREVDRAKEMARYLENTSENVSVS